MCPRLEPERDGATIETLNRLRLLRDALVGIAGGIRRQCTPL
jgi:hypothetical protein